MTAAELAAYVESAAFVVVMRAAARRYTAAAIARDCGLHPKTLQRWLRGAGELGRAARLAVFFVVLVRHQSQGQVA